MRGEQQEFRTSSASTRHLREGLLLVGGGGGVDSTVGVIRYAENALMLWDQFMGEYCVWESDVDVLNKPLPPLRPLVRLAKE
jgi:hypothetical protein